MSLSLLISAFIPIFVTVDAIGTIPLYVALVDGLDHKEQKRIISQSIITALLMALGFVVLGKMIFHFLGISMGDFMVAGGVILFCISLNDLLASTKARRRVQNADIGVVPIGTPLIVGPAVLTTCMIVLDQYGFLVTVIAVVLNVLLAGLILVNSDRLVKLFGMNGARALSKVMALLLAAIAVMMIRKGIFSIVTTG